MYQLSCPHCQNVIPVTPSQAGDSVLCPSCEQSVAVPRLGELKQLPRDESQPSDTGPAPPYNEAGFAQTFGTVALGLICTASLLIAAYCGIRWALIDAPVTTEIHLQEVREVYPTRNPAELLREYEQMEEAGLELPVPYGYKRVQNLKQGWGQNAAIAGGVAILTLIGAIIFASSGRSRRQ
ncbi:hypothetical protein [Novipirellula rosea]|uniref:Uncharacterized protein n=1 Tax=Novipirellula rosea TaxID=1031540 RepID=A0ABP8N437_9BACT|tara:strand:+ start:3517 stop:4059 length:543 start_codon:yes stop_codon:yes gene_type:complete